MPSVVAIVVSLPGIEAIVCGPHKLILQDVGSVVTAAEYSDVTVARHCPLAMVGWGLVKHPFATPRQDASVHRR